MVIRKGGKLASIEDPSEQEFIQNSIKQFQDSHTSFWIGLYRTHAGKVQLSSSFIKSNIKQYCDNKNRNDVCKTSSETAMLQMTVA